MSSRKSLVISRLIRTVALSTVMACAALVLASSVAVDAQRGNAPSTLSPKQVAEAAEYKAYRLSMPVLTRVDAATRSFTTTIKNDPAYRALLDASREYDALENNPSRTPADEARMEQLKKRLDASPFGSTSGDNQSLDEVEAEIAKMPPMANALKANGVTPREYAKFIGVLVQAYVVAASQALGAQANTPDAQLGAALAGGLFGTNLAPENVKFVMANQAAVDRFMQTMQELSEP